MQLKFFTIPLIFMPEEEENLNKFLRSVKILDLKRELIRVADSVYWAVSVLYIPSGNADTCAGAVKSKVDYKNLLSESEFAKFCQFRKIRKHLAETDAVPAYAVFTDSELSEISRLEEVTVRTLKSINGIGVKKIEKYGIKFCELFSKMMQDEKGGELV